MKDTAYAARKDNILVALSYNDFYDYNDFFSTEDVMGFIATTRESGLSSSKVEYANPYLWEMARKIDDLATYNAEDEYGIRPSTYLPIIEREWYMLPIYQSERSANQLSTEPFSDSLDGKHIGYYFLSHADAKEAWGSTYKTEDELRTRALDYMKDMIDDYGLVLNGYTYGSTLYVDGEEEASLGLAVGDPEELLEDAVREYGYDPLEFHKVFDGGDEYFDDMEKTNKERERQEKLDTVKLIEDSAVQIEKLKLATEEPMETPEIDRLFEILSAWAANVKAQGE